MNTAVLSPPATDACPDFCDNCLVHPQGHRIHGTVIGHVSLIGPDTGRPVGMFSVLLVQHQAVGEPPNLVRAEWQIQGEMECSADEAAQISGLFAEARAAARRLNGLG